jgi:hypothetical protein
LLESATWDDIMCDFPVKKKLARALEEVGRGEVVSHEQARELA